MATFKSELENFFKEMELPYSKEEKEKIKEGLKEKMGNFKDEAASREDVCLLLWWLSYRDEKRWERGESVPLPQLQGRLRKDKNNY